MLFLPEGIGIISNNQKAMTKSYIYIKIEIPRHINPISVFAPNFSINTVLYSSLYHTLTYYITKTHNSELVANMSPQTSSLILKAKIEYCLAYLDRQINDCFPADWTVAFNGRLQSLDVDIRHRQSSG